MQSLTNFTVLVKLVAFSLAKLDPGLFWRGVFAAIEHRALMVTAPLVHSAKDQDAHEDVSDVVNLCVGYISSKRRTKIVRMQFA